VEEKSGGRPAHRGAPCEASPASRRATAPRRPTSRITACSGSRRGGGFIGVLPSIAGAVAERAQPFRRCIGLLFRNQYRCEPELFIASTLEAAPFDVQAGARPSIRHPRRAPAVHGQPPAV
jgi:hypothetical protein